MNIKIIPCLDIRDNRIVKGVNFSNIRDIGDPLETIKIYEKENADEIIVLDIGSQEEKRGELIKSLASIIDSITIPITFGGGINSLDNILYLLDRGIKKFSISSAAYRNPKLIEEIAKKVGSQNLIVAMDAKDIGDNKWILYIDGGRTKTDMTISKWAVRVADLGAGEILLTSMDRDGTRKGYDIKLLKEVSNLVNIPIIASGGAGEKEDFLIAAKEGNAKGLLAASLFHFGDIRIPDLKDFLIEHNIKVMRGKENGQDNRRN